MYPLSHPIGAARPGGFSLEPRSHLGINIQSDPGPQTVIEDFDSSSSSAPLSTCSRKLHTASFVGNGSGGWRSSRST
jgi:hypothetical protein